MFLESTCKICGRHIMKQTDAPKPSWFHTPMFNMGQPEHEPVPQIVKERKP